MSVPATCPYCNALLAPGVRVVAGRVACPRCGEAIGTFIANGPVPSVEPPQARVPTAKRAIRRPVVIGVLVALVAVGIWAVWANRHRIRSPFGPPTPDKPVVVKPAELPGLGYLPESTEAVLAVQMPFVLERLGPESGSDPAHALSSLGLPESVVEILDQASAVGLKNVDQLVVGLGFEGHALPPQLVLVIHARQPFNLQAIARQAKAHETKKAGRTLYAARAGPLPEVYWWQPGDRVLVATIVARDFESVPIQPLTGIGHLRPGLSALVRDRVAEDACAWFVASSDKWDQYLQPYVLLPLTPLQGRKDLIKPAERLRSVVLSVPNEPEQRVEAQIAVQSADAGAELRAVLADRFHGEPIDVAGEEEWARILIPNDLSRIGTTVSRLMGGGN